MSLAEKLYSILIEGGSWRTILNGLWVTVNISVQSLVLGTALGAAICLLRTSRRALLSRFARVYIAVLRGTPVLMLLLLLFYGILAQYGIPPVVVAIFAFALNVSAHIAELLRAAWEAADWGQAEAARTLSLTAWEAFRWVTLPQILRTARPVYQSTIVNLIQWTSVVGYVTITDLTRVINNTASRTMEPLLTTIIGMLIYLALSYLVYALFALTGRRRGDAPP